MWKFCPQCGHKLEPTWKFCAECGSGVQAAFSPAMPWMWIYPTTYPYPYPNYPMITWHQSQTVGGITSGNTTVSVTDGTFTTQ